MWNKCRNYGYAKKNYILKFIMIYFHIFSFKDSPMLDNFTVLYAEDEEHIRNNMSSAFNFIFKDILIANDGKEALKLYEDKAPDIVILDIEMPYLNGLEVAEKIRENNKTIPIIITTAYTDTKYFLKAIDLNITTYILKPIMLDKLQNALNKCKEQLQFTDNDSIQINENISYDIKARTLYINEKVTLLTNIEMRFLEYMLKHPNRVISYEELECNIWDENGMSDSAVRSLVRDIRKRIGKDTIQNIPKVGYKLIVQK